MGEIKKHIVCIASDFKGNEFIEECSKAGWDVTLVTREKYLDEKWAWEYISCIKSVIDDAVTEDYIRAVANIAGTQPVDNVVGLDEFDVLTAAEAREHLQLGGISSSYALRFRDKLTMRNMAFAAGIPCPEFVNIFHPEAINEYLENVPAPWIIKPRTEVSAFGIRKCDTKEMVWEVISELDERHTWRDHPTQFLLERFIEGKVFHIDSVVDNGRIVACGISQYGTTPMNVSHHGGVFSTSIVSHKSKERKELEKLNARLLKSFEYQRGVSHAEFLQCAATGKFFLLEVACRVGGAYIANVLEHASGFNLWREWGKLETSTKTNPYKAPKIRKEYAGITLALANQDCPDTSHYDDLEIVYRVNKPKHVGLIFHAKNEVRISELLNIYTERISNDFLEVGKFKERHDD